MKKPKSKVFDAQLFKRLMHYIKPYRGFFILALTTVIGLAVFGALRPKVLQLTIDQNIEQKFEPGFLNYMLLMLWLLVLEVTCNLLFIYYASWLGQSVVRDIRIRLFKHILGFKMKYFDNSSVGVLITRTVTDMERIADIFGRAVYDF
jgi:ATP-binding cassette subfamily B multidrug efflux pump